MESSEYTRGRGDGYADAYNFYVLGDTVTAAFDSDGLEDEYQRGYMDGWQAARVA